MISLRQEELDAWASSNFGDKKNDTWGNCLGMVEELGELAHLLLKRQQGIRGIKDNQETKNEIGDAFSDIVIYGVNLMQMEGLDAEKYLKKTIEKVLSRDWVAYPLNGETE